MIYAKLYIKLVKIYLLETNELDPLPAQLAFGQTQHLDIIRRPSNMWHDMQHYWYQYYKYKLISYAVKTTNHRLTLKIISTYSLTERRVVAHTTSFSQLTIIIFFKTNLNQD